MERNITFGKYKGQPINKIIIEHPDYILWCLSNLSWFKLTDDEHMLFDSISIAILKSDVQVVYPKDELKRHIRDINALENGNTPFRISKNGDVWVEDERNPVVKPILKYRRKAKAFYHDGLAGIAHSFDKMMSTMDELDEYEDGLCSNDFF